MIVATATIDIDPARRHEFVAAATKAAAAFRDQDGCEHFAFSADLDRPGRFYVTERWSSEETLKAHDAQPASAEFKATVGGFVHSNESHKWNLDSPEWTWTHRQLAPQQAE